MMITYYYTLTVISIIFISLFIIEQLQYPPSAPHNFVKQGTAYQHLIF